MLIGRAKKEDRTFYAEFCGEVAKCLEGLPYEEIKYAGEEYALSELEILPPSEPSKIVAVGLNYSEHARELKETLIGSPVLFLKPPTAVIAHRQTIVYPAASRRVDYEAEMAVVIRKKCKDVPAERAKEVIFGYTALNDVTARDLQKSDGQWTRAKSFDTFCPFGPYIDTDFDPRNKSVRSFLNGRIKQAGNTEDMLFKVADLISFISACMTLLPGDVIATGTPAGIGPMQKGDVIEIQIEGLERLRNKLV